MSDREALLIILITLFYVSICVYVWWDRKTRVYFWKGGQLYFRRRTSEDR